MVLTDNQGHVKKWGVVEYGAMWWQDPSTWITYDHRQYSVSNFKSSNHSSVCPKCTEVLEFNVGYPHNDVKMVKGFSTFTECKDACTDHVDCAVWTFNSKSSKCYLKRKIVERKNGNVKVSGTQACYG